MLFQIVDRVEHFKNMLLATHCLIAVLLMIIACLLYMILHAIRETK